jgi:hypothetical protein
MLKNKEDKIIMLQHNTSTLLKLDICFGDIYKMYCWWSVILMDEIRVLGENH